MLHYLKVKSIQITRTRLLQIFQDSLKIKRTYRVLNSEEIIVWNRIEYDPIIFGGHRDDAHIFHISNLLGKTREG